MNDRRLAPYADKALDRPKLIVMGVLFVILVLGAIWSQLTIIAFFVALFLGALYWYWAAGN